MQETVVEKPIQKTTKQFTDNRINHCTHIIDILEGFKKGLINYEETGICVNMRAGISRISTNKSEHIWHTFNEIYKECIERWEHYSGDKLYVVPSPYDNMSSNDVYYATDIDKWDESTPYGQMRYSLLNFLIKEFSDVREVYSGFE